MSATLTSSLLLCYDRLILHGFSKSLFNTSRRALLFNIRPQQQANKHPHSKKIKYPRYRPTWPRGVQEVKAPRFHDTRHMKVVRSSPLRTGRLVLMDLSEASEKIPSDTTGDRIPVGGRDIPHPSRPALGPTQHIFM